MPDELRNTCDLARQHCRTVCSPRQTRSATLRTRSENRPLSSCTTRGDVSDVTSRCLVFDPGKIPRLPLSSCRIGCIAKGCGDGKILDRKGFEMSPFVQGR